MKSRFHFHYLFSSPFRSFFLLAGVGAISLIMVWLSILYLQLPAPSQMPPRLWHMHEMLFGFLGAAIAGFLLTAVPNWTNTNPISPVKVAMLTAIWILNRFSPWLFGDSPMHFYQTVLQGLFWLTLFVFTTLPIAVTRNQKNLIFPIIIFAIGSLNVASSASAIIGQANQAILLNKVSLLVILLLTGLISTRVIPFFISRQTGLAISASPTLNFAITIASVLGIAGLLLSQLDTILPNPGWMMCLVGVLHGIRLMTWVKKAVFNYPLLWSLLLPYCVLSLGLIWLGASHIGSFNTSGPIHLLAISCLSAMVISIATRVSLGHSGRELVAPRGFAVYFLCIVLAGLVRSLGHWLIPYPQTLLLSGALWSLGFAVFVYLFTPIYFSQRVNK